MYTARDSWDSRRPLRQDRPQMSESRPDRPHGADRPHGTGRPQRRDGAQSPLGAQRPDRCNRLQTTTAVALVRSPAVTPRLRAPLQRTHPP
jgi:hypothetical protein